MSDKLKEGGTLVQIAWFLKEPIMFWKKDFKCSENSI